MITVILCLFIGIFFGFLLEKSKVFESEIIVKQMLLKDFTMLKVFLSAIASSLLVFAALNYFNFMTIQVSKTVYLYSILGGSFLGLGVAFAGACPGTIMAQIGSGYRDAIFTFLGGIVGAISYHYIFPHVQKVKYLNNNIDINSLNIILSIPFWLGAILLAGIFQIILFIIKISRE